MASRIDGRIRALAVGLATLFALVPVAGWSLDEIGSARAAVAAARLTYESLPTGADLRQLQADLASQISTRPNDDDVRRQLVGQSEEVAGRLVQLQKQRAEAAASLRIARDNLTSALERALHRPSLDSEQRLALLAEYATLLADRTRGATDIRTGASDEPVAVDDPVAETAFLQLQRTKLVRALGDFAALGGSVRDHRRLTERRQQLSRARRLFEEDLEDRLRSQSTPADGRGDLLERIESMQARIQEEIGHIDTRLSRLSNGSGKERGR